MLVERLDAPEERAQALGARRRDVQLVRDLGDERVAREPGAERALGAHVAVELLEHLHRDAHGARLLGEPAQDGLADPERRVRAEAQAPFGLEPVHRVDEPQVPLLDEIEERQAPVPVGACDVNHEAQVGEDHAPPCLEVARARPHRGLQELGVGEELHAPHLVEIQVEDVPLRFARELPRIEPGRRLVDVVLGQSHAGRHEPRPERLERLVLEVQVHEQRVVVATAHLAPGQRLALGLGEAVREFDDVRYTHAIPTPSRGSLPGLPPIRTTPRPPARPGRVPDPRATPPRTA